MALKVAAKNTLTVHSSPLKVSVAAQLLEGIFVGINSLGELVPADYRASQGPVVARGVLLQGVYWRDTRGNVMDFNNMQASYGREGLRVSGYVGLTPGATYRLFSGGGIIAAGPGALAGDINQVVGYAESSTLLIITLGTEAVIP